jgi:hypothetical protein
MVVVAIFIGEEGRGTDIQKYIKGIDIQKH